MEGVHDLKQREYQTVTSTGGPMIIANPTSKPHLVSLGGNCISNTTEYYLEVTLAYL